MRAWDATMAARIEMIIAGQNVPGGADLKKGFEYDSGFLEICAAWPM
jgi:hypothetical protein